MSVSEWIGNLRMDETPRKPPRRAGKHKLSDQVDLPIGARLSPVEKYWHSAFPASSDSDYPKLLVPATNL
jgi:hypothetical protein